MHNNQPIPEEINILVISSGSVWTHQTMDSRYKVTYKGCDFTSDNLNSLVCNSPNFHLFCIIPPSFDFIDDKALTDLVSIMESKQKFNVLYTDYINSLGRQFLPSFGYDVIVNNFMFDCPILMSGVNSPIFTNDGPGIIWNALKTIYGNAYIKHIPMFKFKQVI